MGNTLINENNHMPILSICIPTYNRSQDFKRMILGVLSQVTDEVELVVRDDSSNFETKYIFDKCLTSNKFNYQYYKGDKIGLDAANLFLIEKARGKFIWWFSDDDEMQPGAIEKVLQLIKEHTDLKFIWANFDYEVIGNPVMKRPDGFFKDGSEVIETLGVNIGLLTSLIFDRESALPAMDNARKNIVGFSFAGLVIIFHILTQPGKFYFLKGPYILCHPNTTEEVKKITTKSGQIVNEAFNVYGVDFYKILKEYEAKFDKKSVRRMLKANFSSLWRGMLVGWVGGWDTPKGKLWKMFTLYWSFPEFWIALPAFLMPLSVNKFLYKLYKVFFQHRKFKFLMRSK